MAYVIRLVGLTTGEESEDVSRYLRVIGERSRGLFLSTTSDPEDAIVFDSPEAAFEFWRERPLNSFHAVIEVWSDARAV